MLRRPRERARGVDRHDLGDSSKPQGVEIANRCRRGQNRNEQSCKSDVANDHNRLSPVHEHNAGRHEEPSIKPSPEQHCRRVKVERAADVASIVPNQGCACSSLCIADTSNGPRRYRNSTDSAESVFPTLSYSATLKPKKSARPVRPAVVSRKVLVSRSRWNHPSSRQRRQISAPTWPAR